MQTLRKKNSPCKFKNEPTRFLGEGVSFKAKLIGILEVSEARGDRMCQAALADLKMAIRAAGEHKQRITVQISIDGLRLRDEKTGECLFHHPVHKISFIAQDMSDSRAFGYIFGSPDTGHRFFGIKTDKAAIQVVMAMRDLFQVVFELKKKEIELEKQHSEQTTIKFHTSGIFIEPASDTKGAAGSEAASLHRAYSEVEKPVGRKHESHSGTIADLLDLQIELNSLQQGIHQLDRMAPDARRPSSEDPFEADPFGDSFANMKVKETVQPILPPPPSTSKRGHLERQQTVTTVQPTSDSSSPTTTQPSNKTPPPHGSVHWFDKETEDLFNEGELSSLSRNSTGEKDKETNDSTTPRSDYKSQQIDVFTELDPLGTGLIKPYIDKKDFFQHLKNPPKKVLKDLAVTSTTGDTFPTNFNITTEPIQPVKLQSSSTATSSSDNFEQSSFANFDKFDEKEIPKNNSPQKTMEQSTKMIHHQPLSVSLPPEDTTLSHRCISSTYAPVNTITTSNSKVESKKDEEIESKELVKLPSPKRYSRKSDFPMELSGFRRQSSTSDKSFPIDFSTLTDDYSPASPSFRNTSGITASCCSSEATGQLRDLSNSNIELDNVPEPPPRGAGSIIINPPPLPPKKQCSRGAIKPPPRPPHSDGHFHYDFLERDENSPSPTHKDRHKVSMRETKNHFDDNFSPPLPQLPKRLESGEFTNSSFEDSFSSMIPSSLSSFFQNSVASGKLSEMKKNKPSLDITLSQLTSSNLSELAASLNMTVAQLTSLTLQQLTECLSTLTRRDSIIEENSETVMSQPEKYQEPYDKSNVRTTLIKTTCLTSVTTMTTTKIHDTFSVSTNETIPKSSDDSFYDKYAVFRELVEMDQMNDEKEDQAEAEAEGDEVEDEEENNEEDEEEFEKFEEEEDDEDIEEEELEETNKRQIETKYESNETEDKEDTLVSLTNLTVKLPSDSENPLKSESTHSRIELSNLSTKTTATKEGSSEHEEDLKLHEATKFIKSDTEESVFGMQEHTTDVNNEKVADKIGVATDDTSDASDKKNKSQINDTFEDTESVSEKKSEIKSSTSTSSDRYAALREIIEETEQLSTKIDTEQITFPVSPSKSAGKSSTEMDLMSLFSDTFCPSVSVSTEFKKLSTKKEDETKSNVMDIFEEIKMLNSNTGFFQRDNNSAAASSKFEDVFSPFTEVKQESKDEENKDDENWAKFDTSIFNSDKSSGEGHGSIGGTSPWSPDGREFHREQPRLKPATGTHRHSGESDNEWKDEEESEESNGRLKSEGSWCGSGRNTRFEAGFEERPFYDETLEHGERIDRGRSFREKMDRKPRGIPRGKNSSHRTREPSSWHEDGRWEEERRRLHFFDMHRKIVYKDEEEYSGAMPHWKCRAKQRAWKNGSGSGGGSAGSGSEREGFWPHEPSTPSSHAFYEEERIKRRMMPWNDDEISRGDPGNRIDRFSSQESMGYDDEERWQRREYDRRSRWEDDGTFWNRRGVMVESEYPSHMYRKHEPHYCRDTRERPSQPPLSSLEHDYHPPIGWEEEEEDYSPDRPEDSPRYIARKRPWPKRPNSANDGRNIEMGCYTDMRSKYSMSRSECSDNDSDPYHRSHRSRSRDRERYWSSDQEFDSWGETSLPPSHWSDVPPPSHPSAIISEAKSETLHRRRMNRHRNRPQIKHVQHSSPFEDDFTQSIDRRSEASLDSISSEQQQRTPRIVDLDIKQPQQQQLPSFSPRNTKDPRRDPKTHKSSSYFEDDLTPTASVSSDASDRQHRIGFGSGSDLKATPEELVSEAKNVSGDNFTSEESGRTMKTFFNGSDSQFDDDAFTFRSELEDTATTLPQKNNSRKYGGGKGMKGDHQYIKKSESVNIFVRENDPFDDDDFFN